MKFIYVFIFIFILGCSQKEFVYWNKPVKNIKKNSKKIVGINVEIPDYLLSGSFVEVENNKLIYLNKEIPGVPKDFFEKYLINYLNAKLPYKFKSYPWDFNTKGPYKIYNIKILDYYKSNSYYILNYSINKKIFCLKKKINFDGYKKIYDMMINNISKQIKKELK